MDQINELIDQLDLKQNIHLEDIPSIDLYMDQVIQLFEKTFEASKRNETDKILTKTMINNYAKGKLFFPVKNKKYSKEHIILISLIFQLKGALSIGDIKVALDGINEKVMMDNIKLDKFYKSYLNLLEGNAEFYKQNIKDKAEDAKDELAKTEAGSDDYLQKVLLIASLVNMSNIYRKAAESLVDTLKE